MEKKGENYVWLSDIVFDHETFESLKNSLSFNKRTFKSDFNHLWPRGNVYYEIGPTFTSSELVLVNNALQHWRINSSLDFTLRTTQPNYIRIQRGTTGSGLWSDYIGMKGGQQIINLEANSFSEGNVIHEIGHAIGFFHEQSRTDRDNAIVVHYDNVFPHTQGNIYQFQTYSDQGQSGSQIGNFDFNSIMLYSSWAFSDGIHPSITRIDGTTFGAQRIQLSLGDIEAAAYIYGPPFAKISKEVTYAYYDPYDADFDEYGNFVIKFYSDESCTIPVNLNSDRILKYEKIISERISGADYNYSTSYSLNLSAGSNSYLLFQYHDFDDSYQGISNNYHFTETEGKNRFLR